MVSGEGKQTASVGFRDGKVCLRGCSFIWLLRRDTTVGKLGFRLALSAHADESAFFVRS